MILVNVFLAILNTSYTSVREVVTADKKRFMKTEELRPRDGKNKSALSRAIAFAAHVGGPKKALSTSGIYRRPEDVKQELEEKIKREAMSSNPWVST